MEGSLVLTVSSLVRKKAFVTGSWTRGSWGWTYDGDEEPHATIGYEADLTDQRNAWLRLHYQTNDEPVDYRIRLETTKPNYGGLRWWFICPLVRRDGGPQRRVAKLYLPSGGKYFGSREDYGLTYTSCQESGKNRGLWRSSPPKWERTRRPLDGFSRTGSRRPAPGGFSGRAETGKQLGN